MKLASYAIHRVHLHLPRPIGDSQVCFRDHWVTVLELTTESGATGVGFEVQQGMPTPGLKALQAQFEAAAWPGLKGLPATGLALRIPRARGGNVGAGALTLATETALWDLAAKAAGLPLYRFLGGATPRVRAYGSTLDFHLEDVEFRARLGDFRPLGLRAVKIKVGHPDLDRDLKRLKIARDLMGEGATLLADANEAWSLKDAVLRLNAYREQGYPLFWIEDPLPREDYEGYAALRTQVPFTRINAGEYVGYTGKRRLLEAGAVDVLHVNASIGTARDAARLAADRGVPVAVGNTPLEIGVHLAASLPDCLYLEYSDLMWNQLAKEPVRFEGGCGIAPDRPGHGIELNREALTKYAEPE